MGKYRILAVDDSPTMLKIIKSMLDESVFKVDTATNGQQALDIVNEIDYDLIITDVDMPIVDGIEFLKIMKKNPDKRYIPIIILSSFSSDADVDKGFQAGASAYLTKDNFKEDFIETINKTLSLVQFHRERLIMVVDDSSTILRMVNDALSKAGFRVITACNGMDALNKLKKIKPDLILSDIDMPMMNGFEFCRIVHSENELSGIPFVVMSANSQRSHMKRMLQHGAEAYVVKPFNMDELVILIEKLLSDHYLLLLKEKERLDTERSLMLESITSLVTALEARDAYTKGHSDAVSAIASKLAALTGATPYEIERVALGGRLHDIGKIGISDLILLKPSELSAKEFTQIKQHPLIGSMILRSVQSLSDIIPIVQFHHERIDGKGYPEGIKGGRIPLWARLTAVADTFHALTSNRPYRKGMHKDKAFQILADSKDTQLCPECVILFLEHYSKEN